VLKLLGFFHIGSRHQQRELRALAAYVVHQFPETPPRQRIDAGGGLVEDQQVRLVNQRAAQPELLLHPARQLARRAFGKTLKIGGLEQLGHALFAVVF